MKLLNYLRLLPIRKYLSLIKKRNHIKLHFTDTMAGERYRLKMIWKQGLDIQSRGFDASKATDARKIRRMFDWPKYDVDSYDAVKLIFLYPWDEKF